MCSSPAGVASLSANQLHRVFVYGSLLSDEVVRLLLKRIPVSSPATLPDYHRFSIKGRSYPAILPLEHRKVVGKVLSGITVSELDILDVFEDTEYERRTVDVSVKDDSEEVQAEAYIWANRNDPNLYGDWDFEEWKRDHFEEFMEMSANFVRELKQPESKTRIAAFESHYERNGWSSSPC